MRKFVCLIGCLLLVAFQVAAQTIVVPFASTWKYLDNGSDQGTAWKAPSFNDGTWKTGKGKFGYGINDPTTHIRFGKGSEKYVTTYFRNNFSIANVAAYASFTAHIKRDDGVVVYVNGVEVHRSNMPAGPVNYETLAILPELLTSLSAELLLNNSSGSDKDKGKDKEKDKDDDGDDDEKGKGKDKDDDKVKVKENDEQGKKADRIDLGEQEYAFSIPVSAFVTGNNVIAIEIHQAQRNTSDMSFDLQLVGIQVPPASDQTPPTVQSINRQSPATETTDATSVIFRATFSEAVTGVDLNDFQLAGTSTGTIGAVAAVGTGNTTYDITVGSVSGNGTLGLNLKASGTGIVDGAGNPISGGFTGQSYTIQQTPTDQTPPTVQSINRQSPATETTDAPAVLFRVTFSEAVTGVDAADFALGLTGSATGTIGAVAAVGTGGSTYDVTVEGISGEGTLGLNLKNSGTGITDAAGNAISGGFTGQTYTIRQSQPTPGFVSITPLTPVEARADATREKEQSKVFTHAGSHWAIFAVPGGTYLWRLDGTSWTQKLLLSTRSNRADAIVDGNLTHVLMYGGSSTTIPPYITQYITIEYDAVNHTYKPWTQNPGLAFIPLDEGVETASLAKDGTGRLWVASAGTSQINVRYSDAPYSTWSGPITIATGVADDDIAAAIYLPAARRIGVLWSNQNTQRFGFKTHDDGTDPAAWSADEVPAAQSALNIGVGMADDHLNMKVGSDGTLYASVKTGYDTPGYTELGLLVRRPSGVWDNLYEVAKHGSAADEDGTLPIVLLNEAIGRIRVVYTSQTNGGDILYKESAIANIAFGAPLVLISGVYNNATSISQNFTEEVVILASNSTHVVGVLASDVSTTGARLAAAATGKASGQQNNLEAYPNPFSGSATLRFAMPADGVYTLTIYESSRLNVVFEKKGEARSGNDNLVEFDSSTLANGLYFARLQTSAGTKTIRLLLEK